MLPRRTLALLSVPVLLSSQLFAAPARKAAPKRNLAQQIKAILSQEPLARAYWGIHVVERETGRVLFSQNADQLFLPASNVKLFTTAAALSAAGSEYRFRTTVEAEGKIDSAGRLQGDLVIMGRGDPNISGRVLPYALKTERAPPQTQLEDMANQVAASGLKRVDGDLIGDDTFYSPERYGPGWAQDDLQWIDGAPVSALTFNDNVVFLNIQPGEHDGDKALVTVEPATGYYEIDSRVVTTAAGVTRKIGMHRETGSKRVVLWGTLPLGDPGMKEALAVDDPAQLTAELFRGMLERRGIAVTGKARARHGEIAEFHEPPAQQPDTPNSPVPGAAPLNPAQGTQPAQCCRPENPPPTQAAPRVVLAEHTSLPLIEDVRVINKTSQ